MCYNVNFLGFFFLWSAGLSMRWMMASRTRSTFWPVFHDTQMISSLGVQITFSISMATLSGLAAGRSILFSTGIISNP